MSDFGDRAGAAVVTGGSGGIGAAIARLFAERGSDVAITYNRNLAAADKVVAEVEAHGRKVLIDAGLFQGRKELRERNWAPFQADASSLDAVVLTHAHLDHWHWRYLEAPMDRSCRHP